jgi:hypothetical protein
MKSGWTIGKKLIVSFLSVAAITATLGMIGYYGISEAGKAIEELGVVRLPSVQAMLVISEAQTAVDSSENALLSRAITLETRQEKYGAFKSAWDRVEKAWAIYEPLPQTAEETVTWKKFVPEWNAWKKDHETYVDLSKQYDSHVESVFKSDVTYKKMIEQALGTNGASFSASESLLNQIVSIYTKRADTGGGKDDKDAFDRTAFLTVAALLTMSEAQTAVDSAENALLCRDLTLEMRQEHYARIAGAWDRVKKSLAIYEPLPQTDDEKVIWQKFVPAWDTWKKDHEEYVRLSKEFDTCVTARFKADEIHAKMTQQALVTNAQSFDKSEELLTEIVNINQEAGEAAASSAKTQAAFLNVASIVGLIIGVVLAIGLGIVISRSINSALTKLVQGLTNGAEQTSSAAGQVSSASQSLAQGASEQAASVEEVTASIEEMASMTKQNATNADEAKSLAASATAGTDKGTEAMGRMSTAIEDIKKSSDETAKIIKTIDEIAFQTNLLALNAAVEAARAGEAGKGFAVVAEEVRNLAQRSAEAARNTADMIEGSVKNADNGVTISSEVATLLDEIAGNNGKVNDLVGEIAAASNEQSQGIDQINTAVGQMDQITQSNAANAEESASASEELSAQAEALSGMVVQLQSMVGGSNGNTAQSGRSLNFQADHSATGATKRASKAQPAKSALKRPSGTPAAVASANEEAFPMDDDTNLGSF